jgi:hypothetical protein
MRMLIRLAILALAGCGAWSLYDRYGARSRRLRPPLREAAIRATAAAKGAGEQVGQSAQQAVKAVEDAAAEIQRAAGNFADEAGRRLNADART